MSRSLGHVHVPQLGTYPCPTAWDMWRYYHSNFSQLDAWVAALPQQSNLQGMLVIADEGDGARLFEALKRPVFDFSAQAKVFLESFIRDGEQRIMADGAPPVQPECNGQLLFGFH